MVKGRVRIHTERCKACDLCVNFCPRKVLGVDLDTINVMGYHPVKVHTPENCNGCGICALMCPDLVIEVERD